MAALRLCWLDMGTAIHLMNIHPQLCRVSLNQFDLNSLGLQVIINESDADIDWLYICHGKLCITHNLNAS